MGFAKLTEDGERLYWAERTVTAPNYTIRVAQERSRAKADVVRDGWLVFDTVEEAYRHFGLKYPPAESEPTAVVTAP